MMWTRESFHTFKNSHLNVQICEHAFLEFPQEGWIPQRRTGVPETWFGWNKVQIVTISFRFNTMEYAAFGVDLWETLKDDDKSPFALISMGNALEGIDKLCGWGGREISLMAGLDQIGYQWFTADWNLMEMVFITSIKEWYFSESGQDLGLNAIQYLFIYWGSGGLWNWVSFGKNVLKQFLEIYWIV